MNIQRTVRRLDDYASCRGGEKRGRDNNRDERKEQQATTIVMTSASDAGLSE